MITFPLSSEQTWCYPLADWGLMELRGDDRQRFLHNQSTNAIEGRSPGQWLETVFVTSTGRTLELATVLVQPESLWVQVSAAQVDSLFAWMDRFIFPFDKVELENLSPRYQAIIVGGEKAGNILEEWGLSLPDGDRWLQQTWQGAEISLIPTTGLDFPGYTLIYPADKQAVLAPHWQAIAVLDDQQWETLRIQQGRPQAGQELTEDYNPLEAGLWRAVSFEKGCYIGQETIARLNTYKGVKQRLWGIEFDAPVPAGSMITLDDQKAGVVTSISPLISWGLGYLKTKLVEPGMTVQVGEVKGTVMLVPYLSHEYPMATA